MGGNILTSIHYYSNLIEEKNVKVIEKERGSRPPNGSLQHKASLAIPGHLDSSLPGST